MTLVLPDLPLNPGVLDPSADLALSLGQLLANLHDETGGAPDDAPHVHAAAVLATVATAAGHSCVPLSEAASIEAPAALKEGWPDPIEWAAALRRSPAVMAEGGDESLRPLVLSGDRLYLRRYWRYEVALAARLKALHRPRPGVDGAVAAALLDRWFGQGDPNTAPQRRAAAISLSRGLCVVTGGPGTGKTTTVVRILAALLDLDPDLRIALAAPTGKAAARMQDAIRGQLEQIGAALSDVARRRLAEGEAQTLHRLLGYRPGRVDFRHGPDDPLPHDVIVADEASMLDLALASKLLGAVQDGARLVLLGDKDQLASVEAGSVFAQICTPGSGLGDAVVRLEHSFRFEGEGGIGTLARVVNAGAADQARAMLEHARGGEVGWERSVPAAVPLAARLIDGYAAYIEAVRTGAPIGETLEALGRCRVLCALRAGPQGAVALNDALAAVFLEATGHAGPVPRWYAGRPVMVTANDYVLNLFNGDVGVTKLDADGQLQVHFPQAGGTTRAVAAVRVPSCETAFAMTIHKAQGSEFERAEVVLPSRDNPLLTRELLYTGLTRARSSLRLWATPDILAAGIGRRIVRYSGLGQRL